MCDRGVVMEKTMQARLSYGTLAEFVEDRPDLKRATSTTRAMGIWRQF